MNNWKSLLEYTSIQIFSLINVVAAFFLSTLNRFAFLRMDLGIFIAEAEERARQEREYLRFYRRQIRDTADPFSIPEGEFVRLYRWVINLDNFH